MLPQNFVLIRRPQSYIVLPADKKIDRSILPRLTLDELEGRANSEVVSVSIALKSSVNEDIVADVRKMLSPVGDAIAIKPNNLLVEDTVSSIRRLVKDLKAGEDEDTGKAENLVYVCKHIQARDAEKILKELMPDPTKATQPTAKIT